MACRKTLLTGVLLALPLAVSAQSHAVNFYFPSTTLSSIAQPNNEFKVFPHVTLLQLSPVTLPKSAPASASLPRSLPASLPASQRSAPAAGSPSRNSVGQNSGLSTPYMPITGKERLHWFVKSSAGPQSLVAGVFSAAIGTGLNRPHEYGPHWAGFGDRYGIRLTGVVTGNAMEASLGALWGEDPRYAPAVGQPFRARIKHVVVMTFAARRRDGDLHPAYARYIATAGNNFLSNTWREPSESTTGAAFERTALGFAGRAGSNAFQEFWPSIWPIVTRHVLHRSQ